MKSNLYKQLSVYFKVKMYLGKDLEQKLIRKIRKHRKDGYNEYQIKLSLIRNHYPSHVIDHLLKISRLPEDKQRHIHFTISLVSLIVIIPLILFFTYRAFSTSYELCTNEFCFIANANLCKPALYEKEIDNMKVIFRSESCSLTKEIIEYIGEDISLKKLLERKSMECRYEKEGFDSSHLGSLSFSLGSCKGELKAVIESQNTLKNSS